MVLIKVCWFSPRPGLWAGIAGLGFKIDGRRVLCLVSSACACAGRLGTGILEVSPVGGLVVEVKQAGALLERLSVFARFEAGAQRLPVSEHRLVPTSLDTSGLILAFALLAAEASKPLALDLFFGWDLGLGLAGHF